MTRVSNVLPGTGGLVGDTDVSRRHEMNVLGTDQGSSPVEDVVEALPPSVGHNVELNEPGFVDDVIDIITDHSGGILMSSFLEEVVDEVTDRFPVNDTALLFSDRPDEHLELAIDFDCEFIHSQYELCLESDLLNHAPAVTTTR